ncbi:MAG: GNAT family N-acetyltransferase [Halorientalis sp.]
MPTARFRRATAGDAGEILDIKRAAIEELEHWQYSPEQVEVWAPKDSYVDTFEEAIADDRFVVHVAERDGAILGYGALTVPDERIDAVYVHPDHHGEGLATALVKQLELSARFQGIEELDIVAARNAVPFYQSVGYWQLEDEVVTVEDVDVEFVRMRKDLTETDLADLFEGDDEPADAEWADVDTDVDPDAWFDDGGETTPEEWFDAPADGEG